MQNQLGLNINKKDANEQKEIIMTGQIVANPQFQQNEEFKLDGFDFGLSQGDWSKDVNINEVGSEQTNKDEFEYTDMEIQNDNTMALSTQDNNLDEFQTFCQQNTQTFSQNNNLQQTNDNNRQSFFVQQQQSKEKQVRKKRVKLQSLYNVSKYKLLNKQKPESQLQQLIKYNQANNQININNNNTNMSRSKSYNSDKINKQQQQDFFSFEQHKHQQQEDNQFAVFDNPSLFSNKQYHSTYIQQRQQVNSPSNLITKNDQYQSTSYQQTQILLNQQDSIINTRQTQQVQIHHKKIFSIKCLPINLIIIRLLISIISITVVSLLYGFLNSIFLIIVHDFLMAPFLIKEFIRTNTIQNSNNKNNIEKSKNQYHNVNSIVVDLNQISLNDQISYTNQNDIQYKNTQFSQYKKSLESSLKWHKYLKYTLYISSLSMFIFILIQITQIDTFFTANYFSLSNWGHIIIIAFIFTIEFYSNCKLNKKINQVMFYEDNYLKSHQNQ